MHFESPPRVFLPLADFKSARMIPVLECLAPEPVPETRPVEP